MRGILVTTLLLVTAILIYTSVAEGDAGMKRQADRSGGAMRDHIRQMSP